MSTPAKDIAVRFARDAANLQMEILHDAGLYRHLQFRRPENSLYWFEIVTWPGCLAVRGDVDGRLVFSRTEDMFDFFRGNAINPDYWAEKLAGGRDSVKTYSEDLFAQLVREHLEDFARENPKLTIEATAGIFTAIHDGDAQTEEGARSLLQKWEPEVFTDTWEWDLRDWDWSFLWFCHAIVWGIARYDLSKQPAELVGGAR